MKKLLSVVLAAAGMLSSTVPASAEMTFGSENYRAARSIYFRYEGEKPAGWKANVPGQIAEVARKDNATLYRFDYETDADYISMVAINKAGQVLDSTRVELL